MKAEEQRATSTATQASGPTEWPIVPFEQVATPQSDRGKRIKQRDYLPEGRIPVIDQGQTLIGGYTNDEDFAFLGDLPVVLFGDHTRAVKLVDHRFAVGADGIKIFRPAEGVRPKYLYYWMKSARIPDRGYGRHYQYLRQLSVPLPPPNKQDEIVAEIEKQFSRLDEALANLKRVKANLKRYKAAVLKAAVEGRLVETEVERARRDGHSFLTGQDLLSQLIKERADAWEGRGAYKQPPLPRVGLEETVPGGWGWASLEQLTPPHRPCAYGVLQPGDDVDTGVPFVRVGDIDDGRVSQGALKRISPSIAAEYPRTQLEGGEVLITLVGAIGRTAVVPLGLKGANVARAVAVVPVMPGVDPRWLEIWLRNPKKVAEMNRSAHEVARKTLNLEDVRRITVAVPPIPEQLRIIEVVERAQSVAATQELAVERAMQRVERLRTAVLASAFGHRNQGSNN